MRLSGDMLAELSKNNDLICSDKFLNASADCNFNFVKRDFIYRPGRYRNKLNLPIWANPLRYVGKPLFVGASDYCTGFKDIKYLKRFNITKIYGTNLLNISEISESVPLGLTNPTNESPAHTVFGKKEHLLIAHEKSQQPNNFDATIYINFSLANNYAARNELLEKIRAHKYLKYGNFDVSENSRIEYLSQLRSSSLVPCPEGNGIDTHRLWETIYMGGTPVILRNQYLPRILSELPVIQIDDWSDLTNSKLMEIYWYMIQEKNFNFSYITASYWIKRMGSKNPEEHS